MRQVDGFGDGTTDEWLCSTHHADMSVSMDITLTFLTTFIGAVKYRQVFIFQCRSSFQHHGTAYIIIGSFNLLIGKAQGFQQAPLKIVVLLRSKAQSLQTLFTQGVFVEYKSDFKCSDRCSIQTLYFIGDKAFFTQGLVIDKGCTGKGCSTGSIFDDLIRFSLCITQVAQGSRHGLVDDFEITTT